jgi:hypothetical protein
MVALDPIVLFPGADLKPSCSLSCSFEKRRTRPSCSSSRSFEKRRARPFCSLYRSVETRFSCGALISVVEGAPSGEAVGFQLGLAELSQVL